MSDVHEVLCEARNVLTRCGWQQHFGFGDGPHCAVSAIKRAKGDDDRDGHFEVEVVAALASAIGCRPQGQIVGFWNDALGRTEAEVLAAFDEAIAATAPAPDLQLTTGEDRVLVHG